MTDGARPDFLLVVVGTGTEVGKTWVSCAVGSVLRAQGRSVAARKPVQSFEADGAGAPVAPTDAELLAAVTGEAAHAVCPPHRWYPLPMAPPMAADALGLPAFTLDELVAELVWPSGAGAVPGPAVGTAVGAAVGLVETVGGVRSPLAHDADSAGVARRLAPDLVLLVADAALGTLNLTRMSADALAPLDVVVLLNRYDDGDDLHRRNRAWLEERDGLRVLVDPVGVASLLPSG